MYWIKYESVLIIWIMHWGRYELLNLYCKKIGQFGSDYFLLDPIHVFGGSNCDFLTLSTASALVIATSVSTVCHLGGGGWVCMGKGCVDREPTHRER